MVFLKTVTEVIRLTEVTSTAFSHYKRKCQNDTRGQGTEKYCRMFWPLHYTTGKALTTLALFFSYSRKQCHGISRRKLLLRKRKCSWELNQALQTLITTCLLWHRGRKTHQLNVLRTLAPSQSPKTWELGKAMTVNPVYKQIRFIMQT